jgi:trehalose 6-phosphate synthase/phosphatase
MQETYKKSKKRLFLLDYDGTLVPIAPTPPQAKPTPEMLAILERLAADPRNTVAIVTGRPRHRLDEWLGHLPLLFTAEHGLAWREPGQEWQSLDVDVSWKPAVRAAMEKAAARIPGSFVGEKYAGLNWHYRTAEHPEAVPPVLAMLTEELTPIARAAGLHLLPGKKVLEARPAHVHKGLGAAMWLARQPWDFILAAGDDVTDEDLFAALPKTAYTIKIGPGKTTARLRLKNPAELLETLASLRGPGL